MNGKLIRPTHWRVYIWESFFFVMLHDLCNRNRDKHTSKFRERSLQFRVSSLQCQSSKKKPKKQQNLVWKITWFGNSTDLIFLLRKFVNLFKTWNYIKQTIAASSLFIMYMYQTIFTKHLTTIQYRTEYWIHLFYTLKNKSF